MSLQIANNASVQDDRHLQYAIKLGIMPTPERFSLILKRKINTENGIDSTTYRCSAYTNTAKLNSYLRSE